MRALGAWQLGRGGAHEEGGCREDNRRTADERTRTSTGYLTPLGPEPSASANSATSAWVPYRTCWGWCVKRILAGGAAGWTVRVGWGTLPLGC